MSAVGHPSQLKAVAHYVLAVAFWLDPFIDIELEDVFGTRVRTESDVFSDPPYEFSVAFDSIPRLRAIRSLICSLSLGSDVFTVISGCGSQFIGPP
jgi:hypothetical protein